MKRFQILKNFSIFFIILSLILRIGFMVWQSQEIDLDILSIIKTIFVGLFFDIGVLSFIWTVLGFYFLVFPSKWNGKRIDRIFVYFFTFLTLLIIVFTFFAEITFWEEFRSRFNFIAVDYLIYTYEVVQNINQSYPLYILIPGMFLLTGFVFYILKRTKSFENAFKSRVPFVGRIFPYSLGVIVMLLFAYFINNNDAEWSENRYNSEVSKAGIYSFFAAMRNNQMEYDVFYSTIDHNEAFKIVKSKLSQTNTKYTNDPLSIKRTISADSTSIENPNVVLVLMESMSASFMKEFGNTEGITPNMDALAQKSLFFSNLFATGTRTVRGMEAMTISIPPTPGSSIVKRLDNQNLYTISNVFKNRGYTSSFFYGGDGYFDNMNAFYGGNGFTIFDRGRGSVLSDQIKTTRNNINDNEVSFENAWGISDEDIYNKMLKAADKSHQKSKPFFNFIMTTSNHKPYTYPSNKIDIASGTGRSGAVKYADYALGQFLKNAAKKPWFKNTVFVIVADHCASSAGKDEIDVANYHIPAYIYGANILPQKVNKMCSQIDLMPTLYNLLNWNYTSNFYGNNILDSTFEERAFVGTYLKLGLLKKDKIMVLSNQKKHHYYTWNRKDNSLKSIPVDKGVLNEAIAMYQTADYLYVNKKLK